MRVCMFHIISCKVNAELEQDGGHFVYSSVRSELLYCVLYFCFLHFQSEINQCRGLREVNILYCLKFLGNLNKFVILPRLFICGSP